MNPAYAIVAASAFALALQAGHAAAETAPTADRTAFPRGVSVSVTISGVPSSEGYLLVGLCDQAGYKDFDCNSVRLAASVGTMAHTWSNVAPGAYGVTVLHDSNNNGRMDFKFWGPPSEMWASSRNPSPRMGPSLWEDIVFAVDDRDVALELKMQ